MDAERTPGAVTRILRALAVEVGRATRSPAVAAYLLLAVLLAGAWGGHRYAVAKAQERERAAPKVTHSFGGEEEPEAPPADDTAGRGANGFLVLAETLRAGFLFAAVALVLHAATMVAGERTAGTLRLVLVRPVSRTDVILAKAAFLLLMALSFVVLLALTGWLLGLTAGGYGGYVDVRYGMELRGHAAADLSRAALVTLAVAPLALFSVAAFGLLLSTVFEGSAAAVIAAALTGLGGAVLAFLLSEDAARLLFLSHVDLYPREFATLAKGIAGSGFTPRILVPGLLVPAGTALVFVFGARIIFARRDVHS